MDLGFIHDLPKELDALPVELAFLSVEYETCFIQLSQNMKQMIVVFGLCFSKNKYFIHQTNDCF